MKQRHAHTGASELVCVPHTIHCVKLLLLFLGWDKETSGGERGFHLKIDISWDSRLTTNMTVYTVK